MACMNQINNMTVEELYKTVGGNTSHYIFPKTEEDILEFKKLAKEGYVKYVNNSNKKPMYVITIKTVQEVEGVLDEKDLRVKQLKALDSNEEEIVINPTNKIEL